MRYFDLSVIAIYLVAITWFGARFRTSQKSLKDYFLGGHSAPWWAIGLSIVSAETSTLTVIGTPGISFGGNFAFLQLVFGYLLARVVISTLFLPQYFRGEMFTAYELMRRRFGERIRKMTAGTFLLLRTLAEGVRVFAISIIISVTLGTGEVTSIAVIVCLTLFYTFEGGLTAVIWTDVVQMLLYVTGAILSFFVILHQIPGGWAHVMDVAGAAHKFQVFDFRFSPDAAFFARSYSFWGGLIGGCFLTTASHGTEQLMVQRLLAAKTESQSRAALFCSWFVIFFQFSLFLLIGVLLYVHRSDAHLPPPVHADRLYPDFIWHNLPVGIAGLVMAAILAAGMSNLSAALNALASTTIMDFYKPLAGAKPEAHFLKLARWTTLAWGVLLFLVGLVARHWGSVLEAGLTIASILYGGLLGVFLLGLLTKKVREPAAMTGMLAGLVTMICVKLFTHIAFTWYVLIGTSVTFIVGYTAQKVVFRRSVVLLLVCTCLYSQTSTYTGSQKCGQCHAAEFRQQSATGHARALFPAPEHPLARRFFPSATLTRKPGYNFRFSLTPFQVQVFDAKDFITVPIEWAFGAGEQAVTFVSRIDKSWYVEHHFSYYDALGRMDVTPGQHMIEPKTLPEAVGLVYKALDPDEGIVRCFRCHSTGPINTSGDAILPAETGVHCEACHGPGRNHGMIRNPKRMTAVQLNEFCGNCHRPPAARGTEIDWNYAWNVRHQPVYLSQSACFRKSNGALSCLSCHQPHAALQHEVAAYNRVCGSCHSAVHTARAMTNCVDCHMPRVSPQPGLRFANHWIGVYGDGAKLRPVRAD